MSEASETQMTMGRALVLIVFGSVASAAIVGVCVGWVAVLFRIGRFVWLAVMP